MKAQIYDEIKTLVALNLNYQTIIPQGTLGAIVECYHNHEGYAVDLAIHDEKMITGFSYYHSILTPEQFTVIIPAKVQKTL
ncbi:MAG TPA: hypothetical protein V6C58_23445 [Allocoleopsis sp.]